MSNRMVLLRAVAILFFPVCAHAQQLALSTETDAPRFLMSLKKGEPPVPIDVRSVPALGRRINLDLDDVSIGDALGQISKASGLSVVYSAHVVPVREHVRLKADELTVAAALTEVLFHTGVDVLLSEGRVVIVRAPKAQAVGMVSGKVIDARTKAPIRGATVTVEGTGLGATTDDAGQYRIADVPTGSYTLTVRRIGYTKLSRSVTVAGDQAAEMTFALEQSASVLDQVVVTGTLVPTEQKEIATPVSVVTGQNLANYNVTTLQSLFQGLVPGVLNYGVGSSDDINSPRYYVRGATTFTNNASSSPLKVYIDGIEMVDGAILQTLNPSSIDRIEILRGPQASTLYGAGAINGVMQIFTKRGSATRRPAISGTLSYAAIESQYVPDIAPHYVSDIAVSGGNDDFTYNVGGSYQYIGAYVPRLRVTKTTIGGGLRYHTGPLTADATVRVANEEIVPALSILVPRVLTGDYRAQTSLSTLVPGGLTTQIPQQTIGLTLGYTPGPHWQHTLIVGRDGGGRASVDGFSAITRFRKAPYSTPADSLKAYGSGNANRTSASYMSTGSFSLGPKARTDITVGGDYWHLAGTNFAANATPAIVGTLGIASAASIVRVDDHNWGVFTQARVGLNEMVFLTAGVRGEHNPNFGSDHSVDYSPRLGLALVREWNGLTAKARASYGRAVRPPTPGQKAALYPCASGCSIFIANPDLVTESQKGGDGGIDLYYRAASLSVTYYDQSASDLISIVNVNTLHPELLPPFTNVNQYQNAGRVENSGWEFQLTGPVGRFVTVTSTYTVMRSTMRQLASGYTGRYKVGDRLLGIPERTGFVSLALSPSPSSRVKVQTEMTYLGHRTVSVPAYTSYYSRFSADPRGFSTPDDIISYPALTKFNVQAAYRIGPKVDLFGRVDNVAKNNKTEFDPANSGMGRVSTVGLRVY